MKKVCIISFTKSSNYGACLQAWSLFSAIKLMGIECKYIDYRRSYWKDMFVWFGRKLLFFVTQRDDWPSYGLIEFIKLSLQRTEITGFSSDILRERFEEFWNLIEYTEKINKSNLRSLNARFDTFIAGSDQIWNCGKVNLDKSYLLDFVDGDNSRRVSYASSFGLPVLPKKYLNDYLCLLKRFSHVSLRESSGIKDQLEELMAGRDIEIMPDPVALTEVETWDSLQAPCDIHEPYILIYDVLENDKFVSQVARYYCDQAGIKIKRVFALDSNPDENINDAIGPRQWLYLIKHASFIVTNSFHGSYFSLIFGKAFISIISADSQTEASSSRLSELLQSYDENCRLLYEKNGIEAIPSFSSICQVDKPKWENNLNNYKKKGIEYLEKCIKS